MNYGGASRDRTDDLIVANDALSQLSYSPTWGWVDFIIRDVRELDASDYTPITPTNSFTASALLLSAVCSSEVSLIWIICSIPFDPNFAGTPT